MAYTPEKNQAVRGSYVFDRLPLPVAAARHDVSYSTAQAWKRKALSNGDDWDRARAASLLADGGVNDMTNQFLVDFALLFQSTMDEIRDGDFKAMDKTKMISSLSDAYSKTMKSAGGGNPKIAKLAIAMDVLSEQAKFIKEFYPDDIERFAQILEPFGARVSEVFG